MSIRTSIIIAIVIAVVIPLVTWLIFYRDKPKSTINAIVPVIAYGLDDIGVKLTPAYPDRSWREMILSNGSDFHEGGWGQCLAAMLAAQTINGNEQIILQGSVSNGEVWQFGQLRGREFVRDPRPLPPREV
jgi:hypothetical protein